MLKRQSYNLKSPATNRESASDAAKVSWLGKRGTFMPHLYCYAPLMTAPRESKQEVKDTRNKRGINANSRKILVQSPLH